MASFVYTYALSKLLSADLDLNGHDIRALLVMANTTVNTEADKQTISAFTTLDEMDGTNYVRVALANEAVTADETNDRGEFDADDVTFSSLGNGTRKVAGVLFHRFITNDTDAVPIYYLELEDFHPGGIDLKLLFNTEGLLQAANA